MDDSFFLEETYKYVNERFSQFKEYQTIVMGILQVFDNVCKESGVNYVLTFGNLISAIRDKTIQSPWDYDIDVSIAYEDKDRLISALESRLPKGYYYKYDNNTQRYPAPCMRICKEGFTWTAIHVDVFFIIGLPDSRAKQKSIIKSIRRFAAAKTFLNYKYHQLEPQDNRIELFIKRIVGLLKFGFISGDKLDKKLAHHVKQYPLAISNYVMPVGTISNIVWDKRWLNPIMININGKEYPIPQHYDCILRPIYGDYMLYLPINRRFDEFYTMGCIVEKRQKLYEESLEDKEV